MKKITKEKNHKNRKVLLVALVALVIFAFSCITSFASEAWYQPNETVEIFESSPTYSAYWIEVEYYLDGESYSYNTQGATSISSNVNTLGTILNFGSASNDVVQYSSSAGWRVRLTSGDTVPLSNTDIKMKLHIIEETAITDFVTWFNDNFTVISVSNGGILSEFIGTLTGGIPELARGIGSGVNSFVRDLFLTVDAGGAVTGLSTFGGVVAIFGGVSLSIGLTTLIFNWVRSIGN